MHMHLSLAAALIGASAVLASPAPPMVTPAPSPKEVERAIEERAATCKFSGTAGYSSASKSKASCSTIILNGLTVPAGETLDMTDLSDGTTVIFEGTTKWGYKEWEGPLFAVSGSNIKVAGTSSAVLDGQGAKWWDSKGDSGKTKPKFFQAHKLTDSVIENLSILNPPHQVFSINGADTLTLSGITIDASDGDDNGGKNTDCFDIGASDGVTIKNAVCKNQDDCVAVNSGTNIYFSGGTCSGGHGLSIGSVGGRDDNVVSNVHFTDSTISDSQNGVRIKVCRIIYPRVLSRKRPPADQSKIKTDQGWQDWLGQGHLLQRYHAGEHHQVWYLRHAGVRRLLGHDRHPHHQLQPGRRQGLCRVQGLLGLRRLRLHLELLIVDLDRCVRHGRQGDQL